MDRKRDLLGLLAFAVADKYGIPNASIEITENYHSVKSNAVFWQASAVYRRLRKKFGIKGSLCRLISQHFSTREDRRYGSQLFAGRDITHIENHLKTGSLFYLIYGGSSASWDGPRKWQVDAGFRFAENFKGFSMNVPIAVRLERFKLEKYRTEQRRAAYAKHMLNVG